MDRIWINLPRGISYCVRATTRFRTLSTSITVGHVQQNAASYRQEPQRQGERRYCDHKAHKSQLGVVARCQTSRRLPNWYAI